MHVAAETFQLRAFDTWWTKNKCQDRYATRLYEWSQRHADPVDLPCSPIRGPDPISLARPRGFHRRDTLFGLFWPEVSVGRHRRDRQNCATHQTHGESPVVEGWCLRTHDRPEPLLWKGTAKEGHSQGRVQGPYAGPQGNLDCALRYALGA